MKNPAHTWKLLTATVVFSLFSCRSIGNLILDDPAFRDETVREVLNGTKFKINPDDYLDILRLLNDSRPNYRLAGTLLALQTQDAVFHSEIVLMALDPDESVSGTAVNAIEADPQRYRDYLLNLLDSPESPLRAGALSLLANSGITEVISKIVQLFADPNEEVRQQASAAFRGLADRDHPSLADALNNPNPLVAAAAYRVIALYGRIQDAELFIDAFNSPNAEIRRETQLAMLRLGKAALPLLHRKMKDSNIPYATRISALQIVQGLRSVSSIEPLIGLLNNSDPRIEKKAGSILSNYGTDAVDTLKAIARNPDAFFRLHSIRMLGEIGGSGGFPTIAEALDDPVPAVRQSAFTALTAVGKDAWPVLHSYITENDNPIRRTALQLLIGGRDPWIVRRAQGESNTTALFILITEFDAESVSAYLNASEAEPLIADSIRSLKKAWDLGGEFVIIEKEQDSGISPYLQADREREKALAASRDALEKSFEVMHEYFGNPSPEIMARAKSLRDESRRLKTEAQEWESTANSMDRVQQARGKADLDRYRESRETLVRIWESINPKLLALAGALYTERGIDPETIKKETTSF